MNSFYSCGTQHHDENCHFGHFNLREATAYVLCHNEVEFDNCRITISFQGVETSMRERNQEYRLLNQQPESRNMKNGLNLADTDRVKTEQITDDARYTLHLSLGGKTINYNGFNGRGYSSCCSLEGMGHCEWEGDSLMVRECDLFRRLDDDSWDSSSEDAPVVKGSVSKPLPFAVSEPGEQGHAIIIFYQSYLSALTYINEVKIHYTVGSAPPQREKTLRNLTHRIKPRSSQKEQQTSNDAGGTTAQHGYEGGTSTHARSEKALSRHQSQIQLPLVLLTFVFFITSIFIMAQSLRRIRTWRRCSHHRHFGTI